MVICADLMSWQYIYFFPEHEYARFQKGITISSLRDDSSRYFLSASFLALVSVCSVVLCLIVLAFVLFRKRYESDEVELVLPHLEDLDDANTPRTFETDFSDDSIGIDTGENCSIDPVRVSIDLSSEEEEFERPEHKIQHHQLD